MPISTVTAVIPAGNSFIANGNTLFPYSVTLADGMRGTANSKTTPPWYHPGTSVQYEVTGDHQGTPKLKIGKVQSQPPVQQQQPYGQQPPAQQWQQPPQPQYAPPPQQQQPPQQAPAFNGQSVGMSINNAITLAVAIGLRPHLPDFWPAVHEFSSDILRLAYKLEHGQLAVKQSQRQQQPPAQTQQQQPPYQPPQQQKPLPGPDGQAFDPATTVDTDVPF